MPNTNTKTYQKSAVQMPPPNKHNEMEHQARLAREAASQASRPPLNEHDAREHEDKVRRDGP